MKRIWRLLGQLPLDAAGMQQRIGDGFYEQCLIREQVAQLTKWINKYVPFLSEDGIYVSESAASTAVAFAGACSNLSISLKFNYANDVPKEGHDLHRNPDLHRGCDGAFKR